MASVWRLIVSSIASFHSGECGTVPCSRKVRYSLTEESYKTKFHHREVRRGLLQVIARRRREMASSAALSWSKELRKCTTSRSPLWPSRENTAVWPVTSFSIFSSAAEASAAISCCCAGLSFRHSAQRKRNIWCNTLEPSSVSGTACRSLLGIFISAFVVVAILFSCPLPYAYCDCKPAALNFVSMPVAKTSAAKKPADKTKSRLKPPAKATSPAKPKDEKTKTAKSSYDPLSPERVTDILNRLDQRYPNVHCALHHNSAWELLVATILSAQCTDVRVNIVTPILFQKYPTPQAFAALKPEQLEPDIRSTGFFRNKAKSVVGAAKGIVEEFGGEVPDEMDKLLTLPGVARKTANVVLGSWFGKASASWWIRTCTAFLDGWSSRRPTIQKHRARPDESDPADKVDRLLAPDHPSRPRAVYCASAQVRGMSAGKHLPRRG